MNIEILIICTLLRLIIPLTILRWPLVGFLISMVLDSFDWALISPDTANEITFYNRWDKVLDLYFAFLALISLYSLKDKFTKKIGTALLVYRLVGVVLFEITGARYLLFIFPNIFDIYFLLCALSNKLAPNKRIFTSTSSLSITLSLLLVVKLVQEYFIHVIGKMPWQLFQIPFLGPHGEINSIVNESVWQLGFLSAFTGILLIKISLNNNPSWLNHAYRSTKKNFEEIRLLSIPLLKNK